MQLFGGKGKMLGLLLVLAAFGSFYLGDITAFTTSQKAIAGVALFIIVLLAGISLLKPKKTEEDMIAEQDERNQYIELKCAEKAFRVALYASFMTIIAGMIAFGLTREYAFIWLVMGGIVPYPSGLFPRPHNVFSTLPRRADTPLFRPGPGALPASKGAACGAGRALVLYSTGSFRVSVTSIRSPSRQISMVT